MRAVILLLSLQALPARWTQSSIEAITTSPLPAGQRDVKLHTRMGNFDAIWLHQGDKDHLALRDPLGPPVAIVRSDGERVGVELLGRPEIVSQANAVVQLATEDGLSLPDLARLLLGRLPEGTTLTRVEGGWAAQRGEFAATLHLDGTLRSAEWKRIRLHGTTLTAAGQVVEFELGPLQKRPIPAAAFTVGATRRIAAEELLPRWLGVSGR